MNWIVNFYDILLKSEEIINDVQYSNDEERKRAKEIYEIAFKYLLDSGVEHNYSENMTQIFLNGRVFVLKNDFNYNKDDLHKENNVTSYNQYIKNHEQDIIDDGSIQEPKDDIENSDSKKEYEDFPESVSPDLTDNDLEDDVSENDGDNEESEELDNKIENLDGEPDVFPEDNFDEPSFGDPIVTEEEFDDFEEQEFDDDFSHNSNEDENDLENEASDKNDKEDIGKEDSSDEENDDLEVEVNTDDLDFPDYPLSMHYLDFTFNKYAIRLYKESKNFMEIIFMLVPVRNDVEHPDFILAAFRGKETDLRLVKNEGDPVVYTIFDKGSQYDFLIDLKIEESKCFSNIKINHFNNDENIDKELEKGIDYKIQLKKTFGMGEMGHVCFVDDEEEYRIHIVPIQEENGKHGRANLIYYIEALNDNAEGFIGDTSKARNEDGSIKPSFEINDVPYVINSVYKDGVLYTNLEEYK